MDSIISRFMFNDAFLGRYEVLVRESVIPYEEKAIHDEIPDAEKSHAAANFEIAAEVVEKGSSDRTFYGMVFQDSDVAKWIEAAAYSLVLSPDPLLEERCDAMIDLIGRAQQADGYLNTYFTVKEPARRWTNLQEAHELYCAGHMIEAAVAYAQSTGKTKLLGIMCRMADLIYQHFITEKAPGYPGHPEIELALMRLFRYTGDNKYFELARHFIDVRGVDADYYKNESKMRGWNVWENDPEDREYTQSSMPVRKQTRATGHAVRAVYLYSGMADVAAESGDESLKDACRNLWSDIVNKRMYLTGGIGSCYEGEAFTEDYHLPNDTAYSETCAAIGFIFFNRRMLDIEQKGCYADIMERAFYNGVLGGMTLSGTEFFYVNPLESLPGISGKAKPLKHALPVRPKWFACACCPPNIARLIPSIANYAWSIGKNTVYAYLYIGGRLDLEDRFGGNLIIDTEYPHKGNVSFRFVTENVMDMTLALRIPAWSKNTKIIRNGADAECRIADGFAYIDGPFGASDRIDIELDMRVRKVYANEHVSADSGKIAFERGPLVYCAEGADNEGQVLNLRASADGVALEEWKPDKLCGIIELTVPGERVRTSDELYSYEPPRTERALIHLIPYYAWANRGENEMRVWLPLQNSFH